MAGIPEPAPGAQTRVGRQASTAATASGGRRPGPGPTVLQAANEERRTPVRLPVPVVAGTGAEPRHADTACCAVSSDRAGLGRRVGALVYEALLLAAMAFIVGFLFLPLVSPSSEGHRALTVPPVFVRAMMFCALVAGGAIYYRWCWSAGRRTLPQKTWHLRLVDRQGGPLSPRSAVLRYAAAWIGPATALIAYAALRPAGLARYALALACLNYAWALVDPDRQFLHDRIAGTRVVQDV